MTQKNIKNTDKGSRIARMSAARLSAVQAVYQMMANEQRAKDVIDEYMQHRLGKPVDGHNMVLPDGVLFKNIVSGVGTRMDDLRGIIDASLVSQNDAKANNSLSSIESLLGSILLCGAYELMAHHETDAPIIISDYIEVTHAFYEGNEAKLVNGVLDRVKDTVRDT